MSSKTLVTAIRASTLALILFGVGHSNAQEAAPLAPARGVESPSAYAESIEDLGDTGGVETEVDSALGQEELVEREGARAARLSPGEAKRIDEIIVHARRRAELLEDTPVSVSVLSEEELRVTGVTQINQIQNLVPNLNIFRTSTGQDATFAIRGIGNFPFIYFDSGVGLYVDGVYLPRNSGSVLDLVDVEQIEVLRGPQGTLFGKNTLGGAINITTIKPREELGAFALIRAGSFDTFDSRATLNLPIGIGSLKDKLFSRFTFASFSNGGYAFNEFRDEYTSNRNSINFLGAIRYLPVEDVTVDITGTWSRSRTRGPGGQCVNVTNLPPGIPVTTPFLNQTVRAAGGSDGDFQRSCAQSQPFRYSADVDSVADVDSYGVWGVLNWDVGSLGSLEDLGLRLTSAWREQVPEQRLDGDLTEWPIGVSNSTGTGDSFGDGLYAGRPGQQQQIQAEAQLNGTAWDGRINFVGGYFAFWETASTDLGIVFFPDSAVQNLGASQQSIGTDNWNWALFTQATADLTDWMSLTAGVRYTEEKKGISRLLVQPMTPPPDGPVVVDFADSAIFTRWSPMASLALRAPESWLDAVRLDHLMGYFTYAQGFRGGGFNGNARSVAPAEVAPFSPEILDSFEWGIKTIAFESRLIFNFDFFIENRTDQQVPQLFVGECEPQPDCVPPLIAVVRNAAESSSRGFELEFQALPIEGLQVGGSVGYLDAKFDSFPNAQNALTGDPIDRSGERLPFVPEWNTHLGVQYSIEIPSPGPDWLDGWLTPRVDWSWRSQVSNFAPELVDLVQPAYSLVNFRLSYGFNDDRDQVAFFVTNLTDSEYFIDSQSQAQLTGAVSRYYEAPRWWGVELSHRF